MRNVCKSPRPPQSETLSRDVRNHTHTHTQWRKGKRRGKVEWITTHTRHRNTICISSSYYSKTSNGHAHNNDGKPRSFEVLTHEIYVYTRQMEALCVCVSTGQRKLVNPLTLLELRHCQQWITKVVCSVQMDTGSHQRLHHTRFPIHSQKNVSGLHGSAIRISLLFSVSSTHSV